MGGARRFGLLFLAGGTGACLRYLVGLWAPPRWAAPLPLAILLINLAGAAGLGAVFVLADELGLMGADARLVVAVGFLGGFTTWSSFMVGAVILLHGGEIAAALVYLALSLLGGPVVVAGAAAGTRALFARGGRRLARGGLAAEMNSIEAEDREPLEGRR